MNFWMAQTQRLYGAQLSGAMATVPALSQL
jgi:hypothetical protein